MVVRVPYCTVEAKREERECARERERESNKL